MPTCRICQHTFKSLKYQTEHIGICTRCVGTLNNTPEPAKNAEARLSELLARGMQRNAERGLNAEEEWIQRKARWTLDNFDAALAEALPDWITKLLAKPDNSTRDFKIMRAHRRGMLRMDGFSDYPSDWSEMAHRIRQRDRWRCQSLGCNGINQTLDVHHIIYLSRHGTNQQSNLITLCRPCHEKEHDRVFDHLEVKEPGRKDPIQPRSDQAEPAPAPAPDFQIKQATLGHSSQPISNPRREVWASPRPDRDPLLQAQLLQEAAERQRARTEPEYLPELTIPTILGALLLCLLLISVAA